MQQAVSDFIFDLHDCVRRSLNLSEITPLYDQKLRELTEKYFSSSGWPDAAQVAGDCGGDEDFLLLYRELTLRARSMASGSFKFQAHDFIDSWNNYVRLFAFVKRAGEQDLVLSSQWIYDMVQEFVYQFQGFCQYRCSARGEKDLGLIQANRDAWAVGKVYGVLLDLVAGGTGNTSVKAQFGYFASIELARLECLLGDYSASLRAVSFVRFFDRAELFHSVSTAHVSMFYHAGVALVMLRRYSHAIDVCGEALLHISRVLRPGAATLRAPVQSLLQKMLDKMLSLVAIAMALSPGYRADAQVKELVEARILDKFRRLQLGDVSTFEDVFESACPKFVSPCVPEPTSGNLCQEAVRMQVAVFAGEVRQHAALLRLRSYMRMYASIELAKLARFNESSEADLSSQLVSYKHKSRQTQLTTTDNEAVLTDGPASAFTDVHYFIAAGALLIDEMSGSQDRSRAAERYFVSGVRKHAEIASDLKRTSKKYGL